MADLFETLPVELHGMILTFLDFKDVATSACVNKLWKQVARQDDLWKILLLKTYPEIAAKLGLSLQELHPFESTWYKLCQEIARFPLIGSTCLPKAQYFYSSNTAFVCDITNTADFEFVNSKTRAQWGNSSSTSTPLTCLTPAIPFVDLSKLGEDGNPVLDPSVQYYGIHEDIAIGKAVICRWKSGNWWSGKVTAKNPTEEKWDCLYDDNTTDTNLGRQEFLVKLPPEKLEEWRKDIVEGRLKPDGLQVLLNPSSNAIGPWPLDTISEYARHCWRLQVTVNSTNPWHRLQDLDDYFIRLPDERKQQAKYDSEIATELVGKRVVAYTPTSEYDTRTYVMARMPNSLKELYEVARFIPGEGSRKPIEDQTSEQQVVTITIGNESRRFIIKHSKSGKDEETTPSSSQALNRLLGLGKDFRLASKEWRLQFIDEEAKDKENVWELKEVEAEVMERRRKEESLRRKEASIQVLYRVLFSVTTPPLVQGEQKERLVPRLMRKEYVIPLKQLKKRCTVTANESDRVFAKNKEKWMLGYVGAKELKDHGLEYTVNFDDGTQGTKLSARQVLLDEYVYQSFTKQLVPKSGSSVPEPSGAMEIEIEKSLII